ncbi:hypothetical protein [Coxiella-like endosymbiont of Rhipicephalus sanguineus]|uniref:hypothetical protein n=1 Tax=Coxiella-like endosymbiont of Rhipicephalus sanguineus TaxID=1955402 RepID=UPI00203CCDB2|nr:hypothetical protein [Coxiella-like endosymbiont of Rhipicephalus sanguineus]
MHFFNTYHLNWILPDNCIDVNYWRDGRSYNNSIIAPTRDLFYALQDTQINFHFLCENCFGAPGTLLIL